MEGVRASRRPLRGQTPGRRCILPAAAATPTNYEEDRAVLVLWTPTLVQTDMARSLALLPAMRRLKCESTRFFGRYMSSLFVLREEGDDPCEASCVDWYGNARPIFVDGRIFALLGYELVEGELRDGRMVERRRISFAPRDRS